MEKYISFQQLIEDPIIQAISTVADHIAATNLNTNQMFLRP